jgi:hypothetical protein
MNLIKPVLAKPQPRLARYVKAHFQAAVLSVVALKINGRFYERP